MKANLVGPVIYLFCIQEKNYKYPPSQPRGFILNLRSSKSQTEIFAKAQKAARAGDISPAQGSRFPLSFTAGHLWRKCSS